MANRTYKFEELTSGIKKYLKTLLPMIEKVGTHHLVKQHAVFYFDSFHGQMCIETEQEGLQTQECRELRARLAKIVKLSRGLNNLVKMFKQKLECVDADARENELRNFVAWCDTYTKEIQNKVCEEYLDREWPVPDFSDISKLNDNVITPKKSLSILESLNKYCVNQLSNLNYYTY